MDYQVDVCSGCGIAYVKLAGIVTGQGLYNVLYSFVKTGHWNPSQHEVWDLQSVRDLYIKPSEADRLTGLMPQIGEEEGAGLTAFVTRTASQKAYGIVLFQSIRPFSRVRRSFRSKKSAAQWLVRRSSSSRNGIPEDRNACTPDCVRPVPKHAHIIGEVEGHPRDLPASV